MGCSTQWGAAFPGCPFPGPITCPAHLSPSPEQHFPSPGTGLPTDAARRCRHTPPAADRQRGRGKCQRNPEGRKLDRQTEADPGFTVPERQPPGPSRQEPAPLHSQGLPGEKAEDPWVPPEPKSQQPRDRGIQASKTPEPAFSSPHSFGPRQGPLPLAAQGHLQGTLRAPPPPPSQTHTAKNPRPGSLLWARPLLPPGSAWGQRGAPVTPNPRHLLGEAPTRHGGVLGPKG